MSPVRLRAAAALAAMALALLGLAPVGPAKALERLVLLSALGGTAQPVADLADYQWDVRPHEAWGAELAAGSGPWSLGLRLWRSHTTQSLGLTGASDPTVRTSSLDLVARARVAAWRGVGLEAMASGGRLALRYDPEHLAIGTGGTPIEVSLPPVHEWVAGAGLALQAPLPGPWSAGLEVERRVFSLDTAHRSGSTVVMARDTFGEWDARLALTRAWDW